HGPRRRAARRGRARRAGRGAVRPLAPWGGDDGPHLGVGHPVLTAERPAECGMFALLAHRKGRRPRTQRAVRGGGQRPTRTRSGAAAAGAGAGSRTARGTGLAARALNSRRSATARACCAISWAIVMLSPRYPRVSMRRLISSRTTYVQTVAFRISRSRHLFAQTADYCA